ncbi:FAD-dependent oxidoreductase [soil metagenome]
MNKHVNYLIIGQGLAGSALAWELLQRGKTIQVIDEPGNTRASSVASGLFNPIAGKFMTKAWIAEKVFPYLENFYAEAGDQLNKKLIHLLPIYRPFISDEERIQWKERGKSDDLIKFVSAFHDVPTFEQVNDPFGGIEIAHSGYVNVDQWLSSVRNFLTYHEVLSEEFFDEKEIAAGESIQYKEFTADKIIFCNGVAALQSKWFGWLPIKPLKGETLEIELKSPCSRIFNRGVYLVPTERENIFNVGATYQHPPFVEGNTSGSVDELQTKLRELLSVSFEVLHQDWGIRPTTPDRRPLFGAHPACKNVIIFNGLGTKGVSLAPYFARHLADWMEGMGDLSTEVNIYRFKALYSG